MLPIEKRGMKKASGHMPICTACSMKRMSSDAGLLIKPGDSMVVISICVLKRISWPLMPIMRPPEMPMLIGILTGPSTAKKACNIDRRPAGMPATDANSGMAAVT
jgi:hypothetical protein